MSHTYAVLEVSQATYAEIRAKLVDAGYDHALHTPAVSGEDREVIDMHGIALKESTDVMPVAPDLVTEILRQRADGWTVVGEVAPISPPGFLDETGHVAKPLDRMPFDATTSASDDDTIPALIRGSDRLL